MLSQIASSVPDRLLSLFRGDQFNNVGFFFEKLLATDFMAHVYCLRLPEVIWLHVTSDLLIACSNFLIPLTLVLLVRRRNDLAFSWMFRFRLGRG